MYLVRQLLDLPGQFLCPCYGSFFEWVTNWIIHGLVVFTGLVNTTIAYTYKGRGVGESGSCRQKLYQNCKQPSGSKWCHYYLYIHISYVVFYILIQVRCSQETSYNESSLGNYILYCTHQYTLSPIYTIMNHRWQNWGDYRNAKGHHFYLSLHGVVVSSNLHTNSP